MQARRKLKRESKVQISDEIIFFDDVAGNEQAKVWLKGGEMFFTGLTVAHALLSLMNRCAARRQVNRIWHLQLLHPCCGVSHSAAGNVACNVLRPLSLPVH